MRRIILILFISTFLLSCVQNDTKQKELELKERELAIKEKELALDSAKNANILTTNDVENQESLKVDSNTAPQAQFNDMDEFLSNFKKAIKSKNKNEISKFMHFPFEADNGIEPAKTIEEVDSRIGISSFDVVLNTKSLKKYGANDYGIPGTSLKFSKHKDGKWKLDEAYGSPDFYR